MRESAPTPRRTAWMFAPVAWQRRESSFMNETRIASIVFDAYLMSSLDRRSVTTSRSPESCSGRVELAEEPASGVAVCAEDDAIGLEEVGDRVALFEELGVRHDLERRARGRNAFLDGVARADGHGALHGDERRLRRGLRDRVGDGEHGGYVGVAVDRREACRRK